MSISIKILLFLILGNFAIVSSGETAFISPELRRVVTISQPDKEISVIIKLKDTRQPQRVLSGSKKQRRAAFVKGLRSSDQTARQQLMEHITQLDVSSASPEELWIVNGIAATLPGSEITALAARENVEFITLNGLLSAPTLPRSGSTSPLEWNLKAVHADYLWKKGFDGTGVVVASMDTGVDLFHQDLASKYRGGSNSWFDPHGEHASPADLNGHGTAVMGVMVGGSSNGSAIGVAPGAQWIAVKLYNDAGTTSEAKILASFQWLIDPDGDDDTDDAPDLVNGSWGYESTRTGTCYGGTSSFGLIRLGVQNLKNVGIGVVFSAGNGGPAVGTSVSPANYPESVSVGMINSSMVIDPASSRGPSACDGSLFPSLVAPGVAIRTADLTSGGLFPKSYIYVTGTSIAAPHVTGTMALLLSADHQMPEEELESLLKTTASDLGPVGPENDYGNGLVNLYSAYKTMIGQGFNWSLFLPAIIGGRR